MVKQKINFEMPAFIIGIIAIVEAIFSPMIGIVLGIIGLVFAYRQKTTLSRKAKILNWVSIVIGIILLTVIIYKSLSNPQFTSLWN